MQLLRYAVHRSRTFCSVTFHEPGHDPEHVPVHGGLRPVEGNGGNGPGGVGADAGKLFQLLDGLGEPAPVLRHHGLGTLLQISGPGIVSQPLPQL